MCAICDGRIFISETEPYKQLACYHCGSLKLFIEPGEQEFIDSIKRPKQMILDFENKKLDKI